MYTTVAILCPLSLRKQTLGKQTFVAKGKERRKKKNTIKNPLKVYTKDPKGKQKHDHHSKLPFKPHRLIPIRFL